MMPNEHLRLVRACRKFEILSKIAMTAPTERVMHVGDKVFKEKS